MEKNLTLLMLGVLKYILWNRIALHFVGECLLDPAFLVGECHLDPAFFVGEFSLIVP